jgi:DedD protein
MARPTGDEELQLKKRARRRLIGAIVLVMAVVLVLPMVLDNDPKPVSQDIDIRIPSPDAGAFKSKIVPIAPAPDGKPAAKSPPGAAPRPEGARKDAPGSKGVTVASEAPATKSEATKAGPDAAKAPVAADTSRPPVKSETPKADATKTESATGSHVVQVAALLNAERAAEIHERIRAAGIKSYTEVVKTARGDVTRVRAGPFPTSEAAENAREQIQRIEFDGKKLDGKVIPVK